MNNNVWGDIQRVLWVGYEAISWGLIVDRAISGRWTIKRMGRLTTSVVSRGPKSVMYRNNGVVIRVSAIVYVRCTNFVALGVDCVDRAISGRWTNNECCGSGNGPKSVMYRNNGVVIRGFGNSVCTVYKLCCLRGWLCRSSHLWTMNNNGWGDLQRVLWVGLWGDILGVDW